MNAHEGALVLENFFLEQTPSTPEISLKTEGLISLCGQSYPENTFIFYKPIMQWLESYFENSPASKTVVTFEIVYFNSSSSKLFFDFFDLLEEASLQHDVEVHWLYDPENESILDAGIDFQEDFEKLQIQLVAKANTIAKVVS